MKTDLIAKRIRYLPAVLRIFVQNNIISWLKPPRPPQLRVFFIGGYWRGPNDIVAQMLQGLKATGVKVMDFNTDKNREALETDGQPYDRGTTSPVWLVRAKLFPLIFRFRPHMIICNAGGLSFRPRDSFFLRRLGIKLLVIVLSDPEVYKPTASKIVRNFDVVYTLFNRFVELYRQQGSQVYWLPMATNPQFFQPVPADPKYKCDVLVLGAVHTDRINPVKALVEHFDTHVYGEGWEKYGIKNRGFLFGENALSALNSAGIAVVFSKTISGVPVVKPGVLDFLAAGALVATDPSPDLRWYFVAGKELIVFNDTKDMLEKIKYYSDHPKEADAIRKAGREKTIYHFTWDRVWPHVLATVRRVNGWPSDPDWLNRYLGMAKGDDKGNR